ncbi:MAG: Crp/Fnr family transcriptional regulator [Bacteroidota bacterium]|jgi:CRP-like cAMP-binding protein
MNIFLELTLFRAKIKSFGAIPTDEDIALMLPILKEKTFKKGEIILKAGEICSEAYYITKGLMRCFHQMPNDTQKTYVISCEHNLFTEHSSFISQRPSLDYIEALEDTNVMYFNYDDLMALYKKSHEWESFGRKISDINFIAAKNRLHTLMNDDAATRYRKFLESYKDSIHRIPQNVIASYLGITPQSLSRLKREIDGN